MKRALIFALALVLIMSMAAPLSYAVDSPAADPVTVPDTAPAASEENAFVVSSESEEFKVSSTEEDLEKLPEEVQEVFAEAKEALEAIVPDGMVVLHLVYVDVGEDHEETSTVFNVEFSEGLIIMQFVDGEWVELEYTVDEDGHIIVEGIVAGPLAFFVNN